MGSLSELLNKAIDITTGINRKFNSAIIVAAGNGTRASAGKNITKQMVCLMGIPVIARTVSVFESCKFINEIIIVAKKDELHFYKEMQKKYGWKKTTSIVAGSNTRQLSVIEGFKRISDKSDFVYIHDGARCLVTEKNITDVGRAAYIHGAAFAAKRPTETVRIEDCESDKKMSTLDRNKVWLAQTPQVFKTEFYRASAYYALKNGFEATDDIMLAEKAGFTATAVDCGSMNIKITEPQDFEIAEAIIKFRNQNRKADIQNEF